MNSPSCTVIIYNWGDFMQPYSIREVSSKDIDCLLGLMRDFSRVLGKSHRFTTNASTLESALAIDGFIHALIIETDSPIGYALFYDIYSSFSGKKSIYLEDLYIAPSSQKRGYGQILIAEIARRAVRLGYESIEWICSEHNHNALGFYKSIGAKTNSEFILHELDKESINEFLDKILND